MQVTQTLKQYHSEIRRCIEDFLANRSAELVNVNEWAEDVCKRLNDFSVEGKMIRGGLVLWTYSLFRDKPSENVVISAAAMEMFQSSFLVHDDIMDRDYKRRGAPTVFAQYQQLAADEGIEDREHFGEAMGICAGDMSFYFAFQILTYLDLPAEMKAKIIELCFSEISSTCVAQMQDVYFGFRQSSPAEKDVFQLYRHKTGRYTFSLPFMLGAVLAEQNETILTTLEKLGEELGVIFQLKDDELGLYGKEEDIGKPVGSDIRENKKTLLRIYMEELADPEEGRWLKQLFGKQQLSAEELRWLRDFTDSSGAREKVDKIAAEHADECRRLIDELPNLSDTGRTQFNELLKYNLGRKT